MHDLAPLMHMINERNRTKLNLHLIRFIILLYGISRFSTIIAANLLEKVVAMFPKPPVVDIINGVKLECSISLTLSSYCFYFSNSCLRYIASICGELLIRWGAGIKNPYVNKCLLEFPPPKPYIATSSLALSLMFADL